MLLRDAKREKEALAIEKRLADAKRLKEKKDGQRSGPPTPLPPKPQKPEEPTDFL
jgi:hypothetical protein